MAKILITSGPTRQFIDPVRFLTNASSGQMGAELANAAVDAGHDVVLVSGPVQVQYPTGVERVDVETTEEMLLVCRQAFPACDGMIGAAAPCDYRPIKVSTEKIRKTGAPLLLELVETEDVVAALGQIKTAKQWLIGFALETDDARFRALTKLQKKCCDLVVVNGPQAIDSKHNSVEVIDRQGGVVLDCSGTKQQVATEIIQLAEKLAVEV